MHKRPNIAIMYQDDARASFISMRFAIKYSHTVAIRHQEHAALFAADARRCMEIDCNVDGSPFKATV